MTICNYCELKEIKANAKKMNNKVTVLRGDFFKMGGGFDVYAYPKNVKIRELTIQEREKYFGSVRNLVSERKLMAEVSSC